MWEGRSRSPCQWRGVLFVPRETEYVGQHLKRRVTPQVTSWVRDSRGSHPGPLRQVDSSRLMRMRGTGQDRGRDGRQALGRMAPGIIVMANARAGSILANVMAPADFLDDNLQIQTNVFAAAIAHRVAPCLPWLERDVPRARVATAQPEMRLSAARWRRPTRRTRSRSSPAPCTARRSGASTGLETSPRSRRTSPAAATRSTSRRFTCCR